MSVAFMPKPHMWIIEKHYSKPLAAERMPLISCFLFQELLFHSCSSKQRCLKTLRITLWRQDGNFSFLLASQERVTESNHLPLYYFREPCMWRLCRQRSRGARNVGWPAGFSTKQQLGNHKDEQKKKALPKNTSALSQSLSLFIGTHGETHFWKRPPRHHGNYQGSCR